MSGAVTEGLAVVRIKRLTATTENLAYWQGHELRFFHRDFRAVVTDVVTDTSL